ncbi:MAG: hypothetical protein VB071_10930 [Lawsonibacter sp.]|nr:hypothetical protein [Lawsonibacter sp.]
MQKLQCEICGGSLIMAEDGESAVCENCGMRFKKEAVKKMVMELSGPIKIDGPVQVEGIQGASALAERAEIFLHLGESGKASAAFQQLTNDYPANYRGWWGLTRLLDWKGYFYNLRTGETPPLVYQRALEFSEGDQKAEILRFYEQKLQSVKPEADAERTAKETAETEYRQRLGQCQNNLIETARLLKQAQDTLAKFELAQSTENFRGPRAENARKRFTSGGIIAFLICLALGIAGIVSTPPAAPAFLLLIAVPFAACLTRYRKASRLLEKDRAREQSLADAKVAFHKAAEIHAQAMAERDRVQNAAPGKS